MNSDFLIGWSLRMEQWMQGLLVDVSPPERPKFRSPLLLIHGLWSTAWCWKEWATHFANLGWECWAINFRGRFEDRPLKILRHLSFQDCLEDLKRVLRSSSFPPVVLAHSFGGLIAQKVAERERVSSLVLLSSLPAAGSEVPMSRPLRLLRLKYAPLIFLRRPFRLQEKDFHQSWLASVPVDRRPDILRHAVQESGSLIDEFFRRRVEVDRGHLHCPILVIGGAEDRVVPAASLRGMAQKMGADFREYPHHGHWMIGEEGGEEIVRYIHRWLIQRLGEEILLDKFPDST